MADSSVPLMGGDRASSGAGVGAAAQSLNPRFQVVHSEPVNVVAVTPLYPPASRVGAWLATHDLLVGAAAGGHNVTVHTRLTSRRSDTVDGIPVLGDEDLAATLIRSADVVVSHLGDDGWAKSQAEAAGVPWVPIIHGHTAAASVKCRGAAHVVASSSAALASSGWSGPATIVWPPTFRDRHFVPTIGRSVTLVNVSKPKGAGVFWGLADHLKAVRFLGVHGGYGGQVVPSNLPANVALWPSQMDMRLVWRSTKVLICPSSHESWGMVGVEAAHSGIPTVASDIPGLRESLGDAGTFVDPEDLDGWVSAVDALMSDPRKWRERSEAARARAAEVDPEESVRRFVAVLEGVARGA